MKELVELLELICDRAVSCLKSKSHHQAIFLKGFVHVDVVDEHIEDPAFHEYIRQFRDRGYALISTVKEEGKLFLSVEVWKGGRGLERMIPFQKIGNYMIKIGESKDDYRILSAEDALSS